MASSSKTIGTCPSGHKPVRMIDACRTPGFFAQAQAPWRVPKPAPLSTKRRTSCSSDAGIPGLANAVASRSSVTPILMDACRYHAGQSCPGCGSFPALTAGKTAHIIAKCKICRTQTYRTVRLSNARPRSSKQHRRSSGLSARRCGRIAGPTCRFPSFVPWLSSARARGRRYLPWRSLWVCPARLPHDWSTVWSTRGSSGTDRRGRSPADRAVADGRRAHDLGCGSPGYPAKPG